MYCPTCLNNSLVLTSKGIINVYINKKKLDNGRFLYDLSKETNEELKIKIMEKVEDFLQWYSNFNNIEPINSLELVSSSFTCTDGCKINVDQQVSVVGIVISQSELEKSVKKAANKYNILIQL